METENLQETCCTKYSNYQPPPQSWGLCFFECQLKQKICITYYQKMRKKVLNSCKLVTQKNSNFQLSQSLSLHCVDRNRKLTLAFMKNWKNGSQLVEASHTGYYS